MILPNPYKSIVESKAPPKKVGDDDAVSLSWISWAEVLLGGNQGLGNQKPNNHEGELKWCEGVHPYEVTSWIVEKGF